MPTSAEPLNLGLYRIHRFFYILLVVLAVIDLLIGGFLGLALNTGKAGPAFLGVILLLAIAALHRYAATGAKYGKSSGRIVSRIIGTVWLFGIPIGTALGIYVWFQTGKKWQWGEQSAQPASA
jgi:hypothetical protein